MSTVLISVPTYNFFATPTPPDMITDPVVELVESVINDDCIDPDTTNDVNVPTLVILVCELVEMDPEKLVAVIVPATFSNPPMKIFLDTPMPPDIINEPVLIDVDSVVFENVDIPETFNAVSVPTVDTFGCDAVCRVPDMLVALSELIPEIFVDASSTNALLAVAVPIVNPVRYPTCVLEMVVPPTVIFPDTVREDKVPTDVMFVWLAVCNVPVNDVDVIEFIPEIFDNPSSTKALPAPAVPIVIEER